MKESIVIEMSEANTYIDFWENSNMGMLMEGMNWSGWVERELVSREIYVF